MKIKILLLLCIATLGLASCKKETIVQEVTGKTYLLKIEPNQWVKSTDGTQYSYTWNNSNLDKITLSDEGVLVYINHPADDAGDIQLPFVYNVDAYSYELFAGGIVFDIQSSDNQDTQAIRPTKTIYAKVVVIPSTVVN
jgi:hypothetical protein